MKLPAIFNKQHGFTLLEVLVSIVILAIGLLGLASVQLTGIKDNLTAYHRSQATQLSYDIIDRIRANKNAAGNYLTSFMDASTANRQASCHTSAGCASGQMAQNDLYEWYQALIDALPLGQGVISRSGDTFTVTISWDQNRDNNVNGSDPSFSAGFQL